jgi:hypothetical protein
MLVKMRATQLVAIIQKLNAEDQFLLATKLTARRTQKQTLNLDRDQIARSIPGLMHKTEWLLELAAGANDAHSSIARSRGRPREVAHYLIMMDLAAIFEYLTRKRATRSVRGEDHFAYGAEQQRHADRAASPWT